MQFLNFSPGSLNCTLIVPVLILVSLLNTNYLLRILDRFAKLSLVCFSLPIFSRIPLIFWCQTWAISLQVLWLCLYVLTDIRVFVEPTYDLLVSARVFSVSFTFGFSQNFFMVVCDWWRMLCLVRILPTLYDVLFMYGRMLMLMSFFF